MAIQIKRVNEPPAPSDGYRVLVDRLWPRGISKERAALDAWERDLAPSDALRKAFHHGEVDWEAFQARYRKELQGQRPTLDALSERGRQGTVTLLFASKDTEQNNAVVLQQVLNGAA